MPACPKPKLVKRPPPKRIPAVNPKRAKQRRARDFGTYADFIVLLPCAVSGWKNGQIIRAGSIGGTLGGKLGARTAIVDAAHVTSRGAGGRSEGNLIPLERAYHERQHAHGWDAIGLTKERAKELAAGYLILYRNLFEREEPTT